MEPAASGKSVPENGQSASKRRGSLDWRPIVFAVALAAIAAAYFAFHRDLSLHRLAEHELALRQFQQAHPLLLALAVFAIFAGLTGVSFPYASVVLSLVCGWLFGFWTGLVLASFAVTAGDTIAFWISRYLLRDAISHRFQKLMISTDEMVDRDGPFYLLSLRLVHVIPAWLINLLMGWTTIRTWTFWWATQLGTLPATLLYVYTGKTLKSLHDLSKSGGISSLLTPANIAIFVVLAIVPLVLRQAVQHVRRARKKAGDSTRGHTNHNTGTGK